MAEAAPYDMYKIDVTRGDLIGSGTYGSVYHGFLNSIQYSEGDIRKYDTQPIPVAVKVEETNENRFDLLNRMNPLLAKLKDASYLKEFLPLIYNPFDLNQTPLWPLYAPNGPYEVHSVMGDIDCDLYTYAEINIKSIPFRDVGILCAQIINMVQAVEVSGYMYTDLKIENIGVILQDHVLPKLVFLDLDSFIEYKPEDIKIPQKFATTFAVFPSKYASENFLPTLQRADETDREKAVKIHHITGTLCCIAQLLQNVLWNELTDYSDNQIEHANTLIGTFYEYAHEKETKTSFKPGERLKHMETAINALGLLVENPLASPEFLDKTQVLVLSTDIIEPPNLPRIRNFVTEAKKTIRHALETIEDKGSAIPNWLSCFANF